MGGEGVELVVSECVFLSAFDCRYSLMRARNLKILQSQDRVDLFYFTFVQFQISMTVDGLTEMGCISRMRVATHSPQITYT